MNAIRRVKIRQNMNRSETVIPVAADSCFRFEMFPEGGNLIAGLPSRLVFKATDGRGYPVDVAGVLYADGISPTEFQSAHAGMGSVEFTPSADRTYRIHLANGKSYPLPEIRPQGLSLRLINRDSAFLEFQVLQSAEQPARIVYLTGQIRGMVCCAARGLLKDSLKIRMPLEEFPAQGIAEFTLYDENLLPRAERLAYLHPGKRLYITANVPKKYFATREKVEVKINVTDEKGQPVIAHLGVGIFDNAYNNNDPSGILTHCYLSSQIRGKIYNPAYYFDEKNKDRSAAMDLLLLTQGWRRYVWRADSSTTRGQAVVTDGITGLRTVGEKKRKDAAVLQLVKIFDTNGNAQFVAVDSTGYFAIDADLMNTFNPGYLYLQPMLPKELKPELGMDDPFKTISRIRAMKKTFHPPVNPETGLQREDDPPPIIGSEVILLNEVTVTGKSRRPLRDKFPGHLDSLAQMDLGPWECDHGSLENYLPGYTHHHDPEYCPCPAPTKRHPPVIGKRYEILKPKYNPDSGPGDCRFIVEDRRIIVYEGPAYSDEELLRMNGLWRVKGYYGVREFYHSDETDMQSSLPDARNTLFRSPSVITDKQGQATVSFYCSDLNTAFTGRIEGVDGAGLLGASAFEFSVLKMPSLKKE